MRTFIYKTSAKSFGDDEYLRPVSHMGSAVKNNKTMFNGYNKQGPRYSNLNRLMEKVYPKEVMTNNFFSSVVDKPSYNYSFLKRQSLSFY
jgi:hypothetical protein